MNALRLSWLLPGLLLLFGCPPAEEGESTPTAAPVAYYECGWPKHDPGNIESTGNEVGDIIANLKAQDQCGEDYEIWDGYGSYTAVFSFAFW
jgi:hypothetical protein